MNTRLKPIVTFAFFFLAILITNAQEITLHNMEFVGQRHALNPALNPSSRIYFGVSSGTHFSSTGFVPSDLYRSANEADTSIVLTPRLATNKMSANNAIRNDASVDLSFGFRANPKLFIHGSMSAKEYFRFNYPKELFEFLFVGNADNELIGKDLDVGNMPINGSVYLDFSLGAAYQVNCNLSVGARLKYLYGVANLHTHKASLSIRTDPEFYQMTITNDFEYRMSFDTSMSSLQDLRRLQNRGYGLDLGATYKLMNDKLLVTASLLDLGSIYWKSNTSRIYNQSENRSFSFNGFNRDGFNDSEQFFEDLEDTLSKVFDLNQENTSGYSTFLTPRMYLSGTYSFNKYVALGALMYGEIANQRLRTAWSVNSQVKLGRILNLQANMSLLNKKISNFGLGFALNLMPFQLFVVSDNLSVLFNPLQSNTVHVRFGVNTALGTGKDKKNPCSPHYVSPEDRLINKQEKKQKKQKKETTTPEPEKPPTTVTF
jgi:hypothetical protein